MKIYFWYIILFSFAFHNKNVQSKLFNCESESYYSKIDEFRSIQFGKYECTITGLTDDDKDVIITVPSSTVTAIRMLHVKNSTLLDLPKNMSLQMHDKNKTLNFVHGLRCFKCGLRNLSHELFKSMDSLEGLELSGGTFKTLASNTFESLVNLKVLVLSDGLLEELPKDVFNQNQLLEILDLSFNKLIKLKPGIFDSLVKLKMLNVSYNLVDQLENGLFSKNVALSELYLQNNQIESIGNDVFCLETTMYELNISHNNLKALDTDDFPIRNILAAKNQLKEIHIAKHIQNLQVEDNQIERITCEVDGNSITELNVANNKLKGFGCISSLNRLKNLDYSFNFLGKPEHTTFTHLIGLNELHLMATNLTELPIGIFSHIPFLKELDLSYNSLGNIDFHNLMRINFLSSILLEGNNMTALSVSDTKVYLPYLDKIGLGENDFPCHDLIDIFYQLVEEHKIRLIITPKGKEGPNYKGIQCKLISNNTNDDQDDELDGVDLEEKLEIIMEKQFTFLNNTQFITQILMTRQKSLTEQIQNLKIMLIVLLTLALLAALYIGYFFFWKKQAIKGNLMYTSIEMADANRQ